MDMKKRFLHLFSLMLAVLMLIPCVGSAEEAEAVDNDVMREGLTALEATRLTVSYTHLTLPTILLV